MALGIALSGCASPGTGTSDAGAQENRTPAENQSDYQNNLADDDDDASNYNGNRYDSDNGERDNDDDESYEDDIENVGDGGDD